MTECDMLHSELRLDRACEGIPKQKQFNILNANQFYFLQDRFCFAGVCIVRAVYVIRIRLLVYCLLERKYRQIA